MCACVCFRKEMRLPTSADCACRMTRYWWVVHISAGGNWNYNETQLTQTLGKHLLDHMNRVFLNSKALAMYWLRFLVPRTYYVQIYTEHCNMEEVSSPFCSMQTGFICCLHVKLLVVLFTDDSWLTLLWHCCFICDSVQSVQLYWCSGSENIMQWRQM